MGVVWLLFTGVLVSVCCAATPTQSDMDIVHQRLLSQYTPTLISSSTANSVINLMNNIAPNGSWSNIDYSNGYNFPPSQHLQYIQLMSQAYVANGTLQGNATLISKIHLAYGYWVSQDYVNGNWWWNMIGFPDYHGPICLLIQPYLTAEEKANCTKLMYRANTSGMTGANMVWTAQVGVWNGIFNNNISLVSLSTNLIWNTSVYFSGNQDGVKRDASFFQHGQIEYSGGYGAQYTADMLAVVKWTAGTNFNIPTENLESLSAHALDGQQWMIAYPKLNWDISCKGREITRVGAGSLTAYNKNSLINPGGPRSAGWDEFLQRLASPTNLIGNRAYWISDYMIHSRSKWMTSVKMYSSRITNNECGNSEGKKSVHLADGANYLYQTGDEYSQIFPLWDWNLIPGSTTDQVLPLECAKVQTRGKTTFVGVVSNGMYGAAAHDLEGPFNSTIRAKKSWYFFDDEYVALGAGISASANTTIDQKLLKSAVTVATGTTTSEALSPGVRVLDRAAWWAHHDSVGYVFPDNPADFSLVVDNSNKTGNWISINTNNLQATGGTFLMYLPKTSAATYSYIVMPATNVSDMPTAASAAKNKIQVLSNTAIVQAVYHTELKQLHATFWNASNITHPSSGFQISALKPSLLMLIPSASGFDLLLSDPTQKLPWAAVSINAQIICSDCVYDNATTLINVTLPKGDYAGQSVKIALTPVSVTSSTTGATSTTANQATSANAISTSTTVAVTATTTSTGTSHRGDVFVFAMLFIVAFVFVI